MATSMVNAYQNVGNTLVEAGKSAATATPPAGQDFASFLGEAGQGALNTMRQSEAVSAAALQGKADMTDVVTAVTNAELTLQSVVAIRDKLVGSMQEIMRMPV